MGGSYSKFLVIVWLFFFPPSIICNSWGRLSFRPMLSEETIPACCLFPQACSLRGWDWEDGAARGGGGAGKIVDGLGLPDNRWDMQFFFNSKNILYWGMPINSVEVVSSEHEGSQPCICMYPFSLKHPSHQDWHVTLSRVPCATHRSLLFVHFKYSSVYMTFPKFLTIPSHSWQP